MKQQSTYVSRTAIGLLAALSLLGLGLRLPGIGRSLGHDEVYTWIIFASKPLLDIFTSYHLPNNHILHTLAVRGAAALFGDAESVLRLPALLSGALAPTVLYGLTRRLTGSVSAALGAALLLALSSLHIAFSGQARGYTLLVLLCLLHADALLRAVDQLRTDAEYAPDREWWPWTWAAITGGLAVLTLPSAAFFVGACAFGTVARIRTDLPKAHWMRAHIPLCLGTAAVAGVAGLVYVPRIDDLYAHAERFGVPLSLATWPAFLADVWTGIGPRRGVVPGAIATAVGALWLVAVRRGAGLYLVCLLALPLLFSLGMSTGGQARVYLFLLPFVLLSLSYLAVRLHRVLHLALSLRGSLSLGVAVLSLLPALLLFTDVPSVPDETGYRDAGAWVREHTQPGDVVVVPYIVDSSIGYYSKGATVARVRDAVSTPPQRLLLLTRPGVPRFDVDDLMLATNFMTDAAGHADTHRRWNWRPAWFDKILQVDGTQILQARGTPQPISLGDLADTASWTLHVESHPGVATTRTDSADSRSALELDVDHAEAAALLSEATFVAPAEGLVILSGAVRGAGYVSVYQSLATGPQARQMGCAVSAFTTLPGEDWRAALYLLRLSPGDEIGVFLTAIGGTVGVAGLQLFFVPAEPLGL